MTIFNNNNKKIIKKQKISTIMQKKDNNIPIHRRPVLPDREILLWEKWIQIRQDETTELGKWLNRPPVDLTMNLLENFREDKERKIALEHAQIEKKTGVRGSLWDRPPRLKQPCYCAPAYELHRTPAEKGRPPVIEHIGVPTYIREKELGMTGKRLRKSCPKLNADYLKYRDLREDELKEKIMKIDPYRPDIDALIIKGKNPPPPPPKLPPIPEIILKDAENPSGKPLSGVYALKINNTVFYKVRPGQNLVHLSTYKEENSHELCTSWTYYFNVPAKRAGRCKMFLQNLGTVTLRYCWKKIKQIIPFIPEDYEEIFFFNKNEDVISPGQSKEISFTFIADKPGIYSEIWEFSMCNISFFEDSSEKLLVKLYADSVNDSDLITRKVEILKTKINRKAVNNLASEFLEEILDNVFEVVPQIYPYKKFFLEAEMFVMKNPVCFYHQTEVDKMKVMYKEMVKGKDWDLSIDSWRQAMVGKEFDDRMKYYELLQKSHAEFLKPWYEGDGLVKEKHRTVKYLLGQFVDLFDKEFERTTDLFVYNLSESQGALRRKSTDKSKSIIVTDPIIAQMLRNVFYLRIYDHLTTTVELCAGILSSLDLNRWIDFDFCLK